MEEQATAKQTWQEALDLRLTRRLLRPTVQPGLARSQMAGAILARSQRLTGHLPLLGQVVQRYRTAEDLPAGQVPIVYARPRSDDVGPPGALAVPLEACPPQRPVAQARVAPRTEPGARLVASRQRAVTRRAAETTPSGVISVVQATVEPPAEPNARPDGGGQRPIIQRTAATGPTRALPVVQAKVELPAEPGARPDGGGQRAVIQCATAAAPPGVLPVVQPKVERTAEPAARPAVVARPIGVGERQGQTASTAPVRPVATPIRSAGQTGVIQRSLGRLIVEDRRPGWSESPPSQALHRPRSVSNRGQPVVQRAAADGDLSPPAIQGANVETEVDLEKLAERVQRELDLEALVAKVQRQLRQRLAVESERRGWIQWP